MRAISLNRPPEPVADWGSGPAPVAPPPGRPTGGLDPEWWGGGPGSPDSKASSAVPSWQSGGLGMPSSAMQGWGNAAPAAPPPSPAPSWGSGWAANAPASGGTQAVSLPSHVAGPPANTGNGWLGDGPAASPTVPARAPMPAPAGPSSPSGWLGTSDASPPPGHGHLAASSWGGGPSVVDAPPMGTPILGDDAGDGPGDFPENTMPVDLGTPWAPEKDKSNQVAAALMGVLVLGTCLFFGYTYQVRRAIEDKKAVLTATPIPIKTESPSDKFFRDAKEALGKKTYKLAAQFSADAETTFKPETSTSKLSEIRALRRTANQLLGQSIYQDAQKAYESGNTNNALSLGREASGLLKDYQAPAAVQAKALALVGRTYARAKAYLDAEKYYKMALSLDYNQTYVNELALVRQEVQLQTAPVVPETPVDTGPPPSIDGGGRDYKSSTYRGGGGRRSYQPPTARQPAAPPEPAKPARPRNTYVPSKKKDSGLPYAPSTFKGYYDTNRDRSR